MYRIDNATSSASLPTPGPVGPNPDGYYTANTIVEQDALNAIQEEICYPIEQAGLTLSKTDRTQLKAAIDAMIATGKTDVLCETNLLHVRAIFASGTSGSSAGGSGSWSTADINSTVVNNLGATVSSNQITGLAAGSYQCMIRFMMQGNTGRASFQSRLRDVAGGGATILAGTNWTDDNTNGPVANLFISDKFTLVGGETLEIQGFWANIINCTAMNYGLAKTTGEQEFYLDARIWKVA